MGVAAADGSDSAEAARRAVTEATAGRDATLVMLFVGPDLDVGAAAGAARATLPEHTRLVGCTTAGELTHEAAGSLGLVAVALGGEGLTVTTSVGMIADGARAAGQVAASALDDVDAPHRALLMLVDGTAGGRSEMVRGAYGATGASVPLVGGCAADGFVMRTTYQIIDDKVVTGAVVGIALGSPAPISVGVGHGWTRLGEPVVVTESDGQRIHKLNDQPALDYYLTAVGVPTEGPELFARLQATGLNHPLGLTRPGGEEIRAVLAIDPEERSLVCGDVPQGTLVSMMAGDVGTILDGTRSAARAAVDGLGGATPIGLLAFDCAARRAVLGEAALADERGALADVAPGVPVGGFYTAGEIARTKGSRGVHNATLVLLALA
ncbi:hypothetical protein N869_15465 [Cellulomonas bogoriensis 69B4 = DSM 16987]|uniref:Histidine kinase n=2 Tax=Cellulomonas bogoriensis TaxID=301388 RepID=A0A0A0C003_9CELL|nr:hypothetical protein N869_15465 [Cellulomonas bogoriensis 69B4 = DSM 16987]